MSLGALVVCGDVQAPEKEMEGAYTFIQTDVSIWKELLALFNETKNIYGHIDHVFVNAGIGPRADYLSMQLDENGDAVEPSGQLFDVSLKGVVNTAALAIFHLRRQEEGGSIVITGSATGLQRFRAVDYGKQMKTILNCFQLAKSAYQLRLSTVSSVSGGLLLRGLKQPSSRPRSESIPWHQAGQIAIYSRL